MKIQSIRNSAAIVAILSIIPHLFCCAIPIIAALIALGGTVGLGATLVANPFYTFIDAYHMQLLALAVTGVVMSGIFNMIAYRIDCREAACTHGACAPKKLKAFRIFIFSFVLLLLDISWFLTEKYVLDLHDHGHNHGQEQHDEHKEEAPHENIHDHHDHGEHS